MDTIYSASAMSVMGGADRFRAGFPEGVPVDVMYSKGGSKGDAFSEASIMVFGPDALVVVFCSKDNNLDFDDVQDYIIAPVGWKTVKQLLPDLTVREPLTNAFFPQQTHAGETLLIWLPIVNLGGGHASPYDVDFYLSPNNNIRDASDSLSHHSPCGWNRRVRNVRRPPDRYSSIYPPHWFLFHSLGDRPNRQHQ